MKRGSAQFITAVNLDKSSLTGTIDNMESNTAYEVRVQAHNDYGTSNSTLLEVKTSSGKKIETSL